MSEDKKLKPNDIWNKPSQTVRDALESCAHLWQESADGITCFHCGEVMNEIEVRQGKEIYSKSPKNQG